MTAAKHGDWHTLYVNDGAWLRRAEDESAVHKVERRVPVQGYPVAGCDRWWVPFNGGLCLVRAGDVGLVLRHEHLVQTDDEADADNTSLFTCRHCGNWLSGGDEGYGSEHGWCGCEDE